MKPGSPGDLPTAGIRDVIGLYRVFLGRYPECEDVVAERIGLDFPQLIKEFTCSEEFRTGILAPLLAGHTWRSAVFNAAPDGELLRWLVTHFGLDAGKIVNQTITSTWASILLHLLTSHLVLESFGGGGDGALPAFRDGLKRLRLAHMLAENETTQADRDHFFSAAALVRTLRDARNTHLLVRGRKLTTTVLAYRVLSLDVVEQVAAHLLSRDFEERVELPLLATGRASGERFNFVLRQSFRSWVAEALPLTPEGKKAVMDAADHPALMVVLLADPEFVCALRVHVPGPAFSERLTTLCELFRQFPRSLIASGLLQEEPVRQICEGLRLVPLNQEGSLSDFGASSARNTLRANHNILPLADEGVYRIVGFDPSFLLEGSMPAGRRVISMDLRFSDVRTAGLYNLQIFFDTGGGFTEQASLNMPINGDRGVLRALLVQDAAELRLRIDPCEDNICTVWVQDFTLAEL